MPTHSGNRTLARFFTSCVKSDLQKAQLQFSVTVSRPWFLLGSARFLELRKANDALVLVPTHLPTFRHSSRSQKKMETARREYVSRWSLFRENYSSDLRFAPAGSLSAWSNRYLVAVDR